MTTSNTITNDLIAWLSRPVEARDSSIINSYVNALLTKGQKQDVDALLAYFLSQPIDNNTISLLPLFAKRGDAAIAPKIYETHVADKPEVLENYPELLELLGELQFLSIKSLLIDYAFQSTDYYLQKHAALGLLHFNCDDITERIEKEIKKTYGKNLFAEFVPALVCKLQKRSAILEELWESGRKFCSTDCNAGIILGFSLCGDEGAPYFKKILFDPAWEADSTATSTAYYTYLATINQNFSLVTFWGELLSTNDSEKQKQGLWVLFAMLRFRINDYLHDCPDSIADLYSSFFGLQNETDIIELTRRYQLEDEAYTIRDLMKIKMTEEAILIKSRL